ncbi:hypothetical protein AB0469_39100 [Streptomyces sp. NPDC093801]|uniref:hypothetical protein n=1 Tax=Streptomyces sp. NPDC093801 TaxID=3155203 RepID=UPI00344D2C10
MTYRKQDTDPGGPETGIARLAAPRWTSFGGYNVVMARGPTPDELVERLAATALWGAPDVVHREPGEHTAGPVWCGSSSPSPYASESGYCRGAA